LPYRYFFDSRKNRRNQTSYDPEILSRSFAKQRSKILGISMPMINYKCQAPECGAFFSVLISKAVDIQPTYSCKECGCSSKRSLSSPNSSSKITVGQGTQPRPVEIYPDVIEMNHERAKKGQNRGD
jgi:predicted nucleic acid-binding Zn ribbon protein